MENRTYDAFFMGRSCIDLYSNDIGSPFVDIESFAAFVGGSPTNMSVGGRRLGLKTALLTAFGEDLVGVVDRKDVGIFVERRAMADVDFLADLERPERHLPNEAQIARSQAFGRPTRRGERGLVEIGAILEPGDDLVVIASYHVDVTLEILDGFHHLVGACSIAHQVAQDERGIEPLAADTA